MSDLPETLIEAVRYFSNLDNCEEAMRGARWPGGKPVCPECGSENIGEIKTRRLLRCRDCRRQLYTKRGTIFEDSPLGLDKWFVTVWCIANAKNGISSHELARALGVTQKTAWFMLHRIRVAMDIEGGSKFDGTTEADTTYVAVAPFHLCRYVAEQVFRFNERRHSDGERFKAVLACAFGRRLTYRVLTGKDGAGFMGLA